MATKPHGASASQTGEEGWLTQGRTKQAPRERSARPTTEKPPPVPGANYFTPPSVVRKASFAETIRNPPSINQSVPMSQHQLDNQPPPPYGRQPPITHPQAATRQSVPTRIAVQPSSSQPPFTELLQQLSLHYPGVPLPTFPAPNVRSATVQLPPSPTRAFPPPAVTSPQQSTPPHTDGPLSTSAAAAAASAAATAALAAPTAATAMAMPLINVERMELEFLREGLTRKQAATRIESYLQSFSPQPPPPPSPPSSTGPPSSLRYSNSSRELDTSSTSPSPRHHPADVQMFEPPDVIPSIWDLTYAEKEGITGHTEGRTLPLTDDEARHHLDWTRPQLGGKMFLVYQVPGMICKSAPSMLNGIDCVIVATYQPGPTPRSAQHMAAAFAGTIAQPDGTLRDGLFRIAPPITWPPASAYVSATRRPRPEQRVGLISDRAAVAASIPETPQAAVLSQHYIKWRSRGHPAESYVPKIVLHPPGKRNRNTPSVQAAHSNSKQPRQQLGLEQHRPRQPNPNPPATEQQPGNPRDHQAHTQLPHQYPHTPQQQQAPLPVQLPPQQPYQYEQRQQQRAPGQQQRAPMQQQPYQPQQQLPPPIPYQTPPVPVTPVPSQPEWQQPYYTPASVPYVPLAQPLPLQEQVLSPPPRAPTFAEIELWMEHRRLTQSGLPSSAPAPAAMQPPQLPRETLPYGAWPPHQLYQ